MHYFKRLIIPLLFLGLGCRSAAREVDQTFFSDTVELADDALALAGQAEIDRANLILQSLHEQFHFPTVRDTFASAVAEDSSTNSTECSSDAYRPTWWLPQRAETRRASNHRIVAEVACQHGIPARLLDAVIAQESGFASGSISRAGAMGLMQIMPGTARYLGLSNPFDPIANMRAGARYLREQIDRFGRVDLALAAYNAGPERRSLRYGRIPAIPETQHYVRTILTNWGRLIELDQANTREPDRGEIAMIAVRAAGYRDVELIRYDGLNASNPM